MASNDKTGWRCPICETVNTGDICTICGSKQIQNPEMDNSSRNKIKPTIPESENIPEDISDEKWEIGREKCIAAIIILSFIVIAIVIVFLSKRENQSNYKIDDPIEEAFNIIDVFDDHIDLNDNIYPALMIEFSGELPIDNYFFISWHERTVVLDVDESDSVDESLTQGCCVNVDVHDLLSSQDYIDKLLIQGNTVFCIYDYNIHMDVLNDIIGVDDNVNDATKMLCVLLPKNPFYAGYQYVLFDHYKILFYLDNYEDEWYIEDISIKDYEQWGEFDIFNIELHDSWNQLSGFGMNNDGDYVNWKIAVTINDHRNAISFVAVSWTNDVSCITSGGLTGGCEHKDYGWQAALQGNTHWYAFRDYDGNTIIEFILPDDPDIAGEQQIRINDIVIDISLEYSGDYSTGSGWNLLDWYYYDMEE